jgi:hypothetical protein
LVAILITLTLGGFFIMSPITLKDSCYRITGSMDVKRDGRQGRKNSNWVIANFNPRADITKNGTYTMISYGSLLAALI